MKVRSIFHVLFSISDNHTIAIWGSSSDYLVLAKVDIIGEIEGRQTRIIGGKFYSPVGLKNSTQLY